MKTPIHQDAEDYFRLFLAGHAVPAKTLRRSGPKRPLPDEEEEVLTRFACLPDAHLSTRRQLRLLLLALYEDVRRFKRAAAGGLT